MWLERLQGDDDEWVHGALTLTPGAAASDWDPEIRNTLNRVVETLALIDQATLAKRVVFGPATGVTVTYQCMVPAAAEAGLQNCWSALENLGRQKVNVRVPASPAEFDSMLASSPPLQALIDSPRYRSGDTWITCPLRAAAAWANVAATGVRSADQDDGAHGYQVNLYGFRPTPAQLREIILNGDRQERLPALPGRLLQQQHALVDRARVGRWLSEEFLLAGSEAAAAALRNSVETLFRRCYPGFDPGPEVIFSRDRCTDNLTLACSFDDTSAADPSYVAEHAVDHEACLELLALDDDLPSLRLTRPMETGRPYAFISYAHADAARMLALRQVFDGSGIETWYDASIDGGDDWNAVLEAQIRNCSLFVLVLSPAAAASRIVRREIRFADALEKPLLCLRLGEPALTDGLAMLLLPLQWIDVDRPDSAERIVAAARKLLQRRGA